ncbi:MAG: hypothetical protein JJT78_11115 [Leptospira sp.]|nr:hypothetical protein [Leptospira sp.]
MIKNPSLFQGFGIEAEYMIVDSDTLDVSPSSEYLLTDSDGMIVNEVEKDDCCWSNELALHVVEIKTNGPVANVDKIKSIFPKNLTAIHEMLKSKNLTLLPTALHPWMNPDREFALWERDNKEIYDTYNKIFDCRGHGWSNLQSVHLNIGFQGDGEFSKLHSAIRLILPLIPVISASSPIYEGKKGEYLDNRILFYSRNQSNIPEITGDIIPEIVHSQEEYLNIILTPMYEAIRKHDPQGVLQEEWLNSRGAIARFDRSAIEIRIMDIQESPLADLAILDRIIQLLKYLIQNHTPLELSSIPSDYLVHLLWEGIRHGTKTEISDRSFLRLFGFASKAVNAIELFFSQDKNIKNLDPDFYKIISEYGNLSERILYSTGSNPKHEKLKSVYQKLNQCLLNNEYFRI